jgi:Leucine-rich repeat (LRR) protein
MTSRGDDESLIRSRLYKSGVKDFTLEITRGLAFKSTNINDLSVLKGLPIESLRLFCCCNISNLTALSGMKLKNIDLYKTPVSDISPLKGMNLEELNLLGTEVTDISVLKGMPLKKLFLPNGASDIAPLKGMPLTYLCIFSRKIKDLSPLEGMKLEALDISDIDSITNGLDVIREMRSLHRINNMVPETYWKNTTSNNMCIEEKP